MPAVAAIAVRMDARGPGTAGVQAGDGLEAVLASLQALRESAAMRGRHDNLSFFA